MPKPRSQYPSEQADKFVLRLPDGMRDRIAAAAKANNRSMNAEIVNVLELMFPEPPPLSDLVTVIHGTIARLNREATDKEVRDLYYSLESLCERIDQGESPEWTSRQKKSEGAN